MKRCLTLLLCLGAIASAQDIFSRPKPAGSDGAPLYTWPEDNRPPLRVQILASDCVVEYSSETDQTGHPAQGIPVTIDGWWTLQAPNDPKSGGAHYHELVNGGRPNPSASVPGLRSAPNTQRTGQNGCVIWLLDFPGFSGWWTTQYYAPGTQNPYIGENSYYGFLNLGPFIGRGGQFLTQTSTDIRDADILHDGLTDYFRAETNATLWNGIKLYYKLTIDLVTLRRGSLVFGGCLDDTSTWSCLTGAEHREGKDVTLDNPAVTEGRDDLFLNLVASLQYLGCTLSQDQLGNPAPITNGVYAYWATKYMTEYECERGVTTRQPPHLPPCGGLIPCGVN